MKLEEERKTLELLLFFINVKFVYNNRNFLFNLIVHCNHKKKVELLVGSCKLKLTKLTICLKSIYSNK